LFLANKASTLLKHDPELKHLIKLLLLPTPYLIRTPYTASLSGVFCTTKPVVESMDTFSELAFSLICLKPQKTPYFSKGLTAMSLIKQAL
jgi:hypothetical protein